MTALVARLSPGWPGPRDAPVALLLHGFGANEHDLAALGPQVAPRLAWAALRAPIALGPGGHAWFEIVTPGHPAPEPVARATDAIWSWVEAHVPSTTGILPVGFSQGGLMATELLRTRPERVVGTVVLGGFVQGAARPADEALAASRPPVFWGRGSADAVIAPAAIERTAAWLPAHATLTQRVYPGLGHGISAAEADDVRRFVAGVCGPLA